MNPDLDFLLSVIYDADPLIHEHLADLRKSGLTDATIRLQKLRTIPPHMIPALLGFDLPLSVRPLMLIPYPDPRGGFMDHVRVKLFPPLEHERGTVKYSQPRRTSPRLFFSLATLREALEGEGPLWCVEGEKKCLAVAQLGLPAVGFAGIQGWHVAGSRELLSDFSALRLTDRVVELAADGDVATNPNVERGVREFADALRSRGARPRLVELPNVL